MCAFWKLKMYLKSRLYPSVSVCFRRNEGSYESFIADPDEYFNQTRKNMKNIFHSYTSASGEQAWVYSAYSEHISLHAGYWKGDCLTYDPPGHTLASPNEVSK